MTILKAFYVYATNAQYFYIAEDKEAAQRKAQADHITRRNLYGGLATTWEIGEGPIDRPWYDRYQKVADMVNRLPEKERPQGRITSSEYMLGDRCMTLYYVGGVLLLESMKELQELRALRDHLDGLGQMMGWKEIS